MIERSRRVVLLIDYDNLQICASRDTPGRELQLTPVVQLAQRYGTVILARAYAEWNLSTERLGVYKAGIEPAFAPVLRTESDRSGKSLADTVMVAEGMDMLWTLSPDVVVLATSDKDLIPLVRVAKQRGAFVVVLGSDFTAIPLREMADDHVTYRQLITDASGRFTADAGTGSTRQPAALAEPARRRSRDRAGRDRVASPPATTGTSPTTAVARPERDTPAAAAAAAVTEPVAPVTAGPTVDADSTAATRRRRRRGSRRRSDRVGQSLDGSGLGEGQGDGGPGDATEITPTTSAVEVALASSGTAEAPSDEFEQPAPPAAEPVAAPRDRRRRTRTTAVAKDAATTPAESAASSAEAPLAGLTPQSADIAPAPEPAVPNGTSETEAAAAAPRARPRRVASASRGRTRSSGR
jgi:uncharacterized LabA/DUF88 family protein